MSKQQDDRQSISQVRQVLAWPSAKDGSTGFPEQTLTSVMNRPNVGLCLSGGGARAYSAAWGQLRALNDVGFLDNVRYITGISGGSWALTNFSYFTTPGSLDDFLGSQYAPGKLTQSVLQGMESYEMGYAATRDFSADFIENLFSIFFEWDFSAHEAWAYTVGQIYLSPYGLFPTGDLTKNSYPDIGLFTLDKEEANRLKSWNKDLQNYTFHKLRNGAKLPYPIIGSTVLPNGTGNPLYMPGFEATPLCVGRRTSVPVDVKGPLTSVGGGWQEGAGHGGGNPVFPNFSWGTKINESLPPRPFSLADMTGTSSAAYAQKFMEYLGLGELDPDVPYWSFDNTDTTADTLFGDGGIIDNYGIMPMLERQVQLIVVFINTSQPLSTSYNPSNQSSAPDDDPGKYIDSCLPALFGYWSDKWKFYYPNNAVFSQSDYAGVVNQLIQSKENGEIPSAVSVLNTVENKWWGVGAYTTTILWVYLDKGENWIGDLTDYAKGLLDTDDFKDFPNYETIDQDGIMKINLNTQQVNMLSQFTGSFFEPEGGTGYAKLSELIARL